MPGAEFPWGRTISRRRAPARGPVVPLTRSKSRGAAWWLRAGAVLVILLACEQTVDALPITLEWDPNSEPDLAGYVVLYGTQPSIYTGQVDVGNRTSWGFDLTDGQSFYFVVRRITSFVNHPHVTISASSE